MVILAAAAVFGTIVLVVLAATSQLEARSAVRSALRQIDEYDVPSVRAEELSRTLRSRVGLPAAQRLVRLGRRFTPTGYVLQTAEKLTQAGRARSDDLDRFLAVRVVTIACIPVVFAFSFLVLNVGSRLQLAIAVFATMLLVLGPDAKLNREVAVRRYAIQVALPDVLDLLTISVEAGLGFEQALDRTVSSVPGPLSEEFGRMLGEVRAGASRADALRAFDQRAGVPELKSFVLALLQADTFGVSIGRVLRLQADEMRVRRRQLAQEMAQKAPVKMLFPMVFCIFPSLFIVVLGPAMITTLEGLRNA